MQAKFNLEREIKNELVCGISRATFVSMHFHSHIELCLVRSGEVQVIINGSKKTLCAGEMSVALSYRKADCAESLYLIIPSGICGEFLKLLSGRRTVTPFIDDPETVKTVSEAMEKLIRETFGISFVEYLTMIRLREAILLLSKGQKSITECALESGFGSMRSFYRAFQNEFGATPKEYLKNTQNGKKQ